MRSIEYFEGGSDERTGYLLRQVEIPAHNPIENLGQRLKRSEKNSIKLNDQNSRLP